MALTGTLHSVDQYLNVKLTDVHVVEAERYPQLVSARRVICFVAPVSSTSFRISCDSEPRQSGRDDMHTYDMYVEQ